MPLLHSGGYEWANWELHYEVIALCLLLLGSYRWAITNLRQSLPDAGRVPRRQIALFGLGVLTIYLAAGSPMHDLAEEHLASAHMLQHVMLTLIAAPLLLAGVPSWVWQAILRVRGVMPVARLLTRPLMTLALFNTAMLFGHLPPTVELQVEHWWFHIGVHAALLVAGLLMWWPVLSNVPELPPLSYPAQMGYLFLQSLVPSVMASFITFSDSVVYDVYDNGEFWGIDPITDQQIAGGLMKLLGSLILWSFMAAAFFKWYAREEAEARGPTWGEVEEELQTLGLTKR